MKISIILTVVLAGVLVSSCKSIPTQARMAEDATKQEIQSYTTCEKIDALVSAYTNDFDGIKLKAISTPISQLWKAKYHLVGNDCQIWSWGNQVTTYSCSVTAPNKVVAQHYFDSAKTEALTCIGNEWKMTEAPSNNNKGLKVTFENAEKGMSISAQMIPNEGLFKSGWGVYYLIGSIDQPY